MSKLIRIILVLHFVIACSTSQKIQGPRGPSSIYANLPNAEKIRVIGENFNKVILESTYLGATDKIRTFDIGLQYLNTSLKMLELNLQNCCEKLESWSSFYNLEQIQKFNLTHLAHYEASTIDHYNQYLPLLRESGHLPAIESLSHLTNENKLEIIATAENKLTNELNILLHSDVWKFENLNFANKSYETLIKNFIPYYFQNIPKAWVKNIVSDLIDMRRKPTNDEILKIFFMNSGPAMGKVLQQLAKEPGVGSSLEELLTQMESSGKEAPYELILRILNSENKNYKFGEVEKKALGTGTVAQVNRGKVIVNGEEVETAIRFLRPGIETKVDQDVIILNQFIKDLKKQNSMSASDIKVYQKLMSGVENVLKMELDIDGTIKKQKLAEKIYSKSYVYKNSLSEELADQSVISFHVPKIYEAKTTKTKIMVQELVTGGVKYSKLPDDNKKALVARYLVQNWLTELIFESGDYHADLHEGNYKTIVVENEKDIKVFLFDFGMMEKIQKQEQRALVLTAVGSKTNDSKLISSGLYLFQKDRLSYKDFLLHVNQEIAENGTHTLDEWLNWALKKGHIDSDTFGILARSTKLILQPTQQLIEFKILKSVALDLAKQYAGKMILDVNGKYPVKKLDILKMSWSYLKFSCASALGQLFKD